MGNDDEEGSTKKKREDGIVSTPEIDELDTRIMVLNKDKDKADELCKKVNLVND